MSKRPGKLSAEGQFETLRLVLGSGWVGDWTAAVDGGANVGRWTAELARWFAVVHAFEPAPDTAAQLREGPGAMANVVVHEAALLDMACRVDVLSPPGKPGLMSRYVAPAATGAVAAMTIDGLGLSGCGLIKLDLEGAEHAALLGARATLWRCRPVLIVEIDGRARRNGFAHGDAETMQLLAAIGYRPALQRGPDVVFRHQGGRA